jgi:hypothetical protein
VYGAAIFACERKSHHFVQIVASVTMEYVLHRGHFSHLHRANLNVLLLTAQACWKPKYVKQKEAARSQAQPAAQEALPQSPSAPGNKTLSGPALLQAQQLTPEELVAQSFQRFKRRLHHASMRWVEARNGGNRGAVSVHVSFPVFAFWRCTWKTVKRFLQRTVGASYRTVWSLYFCFLPLLRSS